MLPQIAGAQVEALGATIDTFAVPGSDGSKLEQLIGGSGSWSFLSSRGPGSFQIYKPTGISEIPIFWKGLAVGAAGGLLIGGLTVWFVKRKKR